jgi:hypothetical protein
MLLLMNTSKITVRLDAERNQAELEILTPRDAGEPLRIEPSLQRLGIRHRGLIELSTPRYFVTRAKLTELDGSKLDVTRVMQVLRAARNNARVPCRKAA